jgi:hypothetical protein
MRRLALFVVLAALLPNAEAQRMAPQFPTPRPAPYHRAFLYPIPFFYDPLFSDATFRPEYSAPAPTVIVMQAPSPSESAPVRVPPPAAQPLLIELRGKRYVRLSGGATSGAEMIDQEPASAKPQQASRNPAMARDLAPAILVFRDGHREDVSEYFITDGVLFARANYYTDGTWNRKIELARLNLSETVDANRSRGVRFQLPASPNEVMVGP